MLRQRPTPVSLVLLLAVATALSLAAPPAQAQCNRTLVANVVALDQVFFWNRLGAVQPQGMIFALAHDVEAVGGGSTLSAGNVRLRADKRPRPLVLRMNVGDCLQIEFRNLLAPGRVDQHQPAVRKASIHAIGLELRSSIADDGSYVGKNASSLVDPGGSATYTLYAAREGQHLIYSAGTTTGGEGDGGQINTGLFGAIVVEPVGANWYRSQVTAADLDLATTGFNNSSGHPVIDYEARYPTGHPKAGRPILNMLDGTTIVHSDLTAVITYGSPQNSFLQPGWFPEGHFPPNVFTHPERRQPFREFVTIYHDEIGAVQAFPLFNQEFSGMSHALHSGRDAFAINYGTGGIGAEILANRFGVGPMHDCEDCKYEEFFLTSWAVGDPAMVVDEPANTDCMITTQDPNGIRASDPTFESKVDALRGPSFSQTCLQPGPKATKAFFPDDPSNVYHGYLRDHTRFRVLHAGSKEHHIHHLHAHQWLYSGDSDESTYLDSQAFGPGSGFTTEIAYEGGGNKNLTPGDSIFHCHFYPHFAQGMWALWRVHDVFEAGTVLDAEGRPAVESRALPDGEIAAGTPIPAVIPLPGKPLAPLPAQVWIANGQVEIEPAATLAARRDAFLAGNWYQQQWNPGFPFYIPGIAGKRPPHPPIDTIHDGGLPRHLIADSNNIDEAHTRLDFHKHLLDALPVWLPEAGTDYEQLAMDFHAVRSHPSCQSDGFCDQSFLANGRPPAPGAPYADPCVDHNGDVPEGMQMLLYKAADIQLDAVLNKDGWHYYQQRITALWEDVAALENRSKPPEPLFFRANSREHCIEYWLANLVPYEYEQDAFQVRTPTDILGQHIHLVKFDVLASDGAANGFNYEDGTFSPDEVMERIHAIRARNGCPALAQGTSAGTLAGAGAGAESLTASASAVPSGYPGPECPTPVAHPKFGVLGAQTTVQRWYPDPVYDNQQNDRTLRTVFTHDHFGPSTHQQAGLYSGLVVEPEGTRWLHNETGAYLGPNPLVPGSNPPKADGRGDGGPTSWQAVIEAGSSDPRAEEHTFREFLLEFQDFALAHEENAPSDNTAINPPARQNAGLQDLIEVSPTCSPGGPGRPCPELISADDIGTMTVNYRNEPLALRVRDPATNGQAAGDAGDLSLAFSSRVDRADNDFDVQPTVYPDLTADLRPRDPYTPLLRAYENDRVQIRILVGAHEEGHNFSIHGIKWLFEPSWENSGYRGSQMMGISEHFEFIVPHLIKNPGASAVDRLWSAGSSTDDYWNGLWGLFRSYTGLRPDLQALPTNPDGRAYLEPGTVGQFDFSCPNEAPLRSFDVTAITAQQALPNGELVYNGRTDDFPPLFDPTAILYVRTSDLVTGNNGLELAANVPVEPLILRAAAGDCIELVLRNELPEQLLELDGWNTLPMIVRGFNANDLTPSSRVGLSPQMLYYDVSRYDGHDVGINDLSLGSNRQTVAPGAAKAYKWYAGDVVVSSDGTATPTPIEFGATNLISSDPLEHASKGAIGALIIEPQGATWTEHSHSRAVADVTNPSPVAGQDATFREFVLVFQNDVNLRSRFGFASSGGVSDPTYGEPVPNLDANSVTDPEDTGGKALNYRSEPLWKRVSYDPSALGFSDTRDFTDWWDVVSNTKVGGDPVTPVFRAAPGDAIRFRLLQPGGHSRNEVFALHGHSWDQEPYVEGSTRIGRNPLSFWEGARMGHGPTNHFDAVIRHGAGGTFGVEGDYLYRDFVSIGFEYGLWGILRVGPTLDEEPCGTEVCTGDFHCCGDCYGCYGPGETCPILECAPESSTAGEEVLPWLE